MQELSRGSREAFQKVTFTLIENTPQSHTHACTNIAGIWCHMLDVGPLSFALGADGYIISLLEPDMEHVFVCLCLDSIRIHHLSVEKLSVYYYSVNMFDRVLLPLHVLISLLLVLLRLLVHVLFIETFGSNVLDYMINSLS